MSSNRRIGDAQLACPRCKPREVSTISLGNSPKHVPRSSLRELVRTLPQEFFGLLEARDQHPVDGLDAPLGLHAQCLGLAGLADTLDNDLGRARGAEAAAAAQAESDSNLLRLEVDLLNHAFLVDELHDHHAGDGRHGRVHRRAGRLRGVLRGNLGGVDGRGCGALDGLGCILRGRLGRLRGVVGHDNDALLVAVLGHLGGRLLDLLGGVLRGVGDFRGLALDLRLDAVLIDVLGDGLDSLLGVRATSGTHFLLGRRKAERLHNRSEAPKFEINA
mmetsp:Transcript_35975/g.116428  ORF Transcript_35975/g.116428 Transcript_35975/m.116428 type:complete len:275 (-) Transcript_35975:13-837(-)